MYKLLEGWCELCEWVDFCLSHKLGLINCMQLLHLTFFCFCFSSYSDLYVSCQVFANGQPLCLPSRTAYRPFTTRWK